MVYHVLRGCHLNNLEASKVDQNLRKRHIPMLKIESEYDEGDVEQIRTRVEAFLEMIKSRKEYEKVGAREVEEVTSFKDSKLEDMKESLGSISDKYKDSTRQAEEDKRSLEEEVRRL